MRNNISKSKSPQNRTRVAGTDLSLARYAETLATILHHHPEQVAEVVARLGLTADEWSAAERAWNEILICTGHRDDGMIALEFTSQFARTRKRLGLTKPEITKLGPLPMASAAFQVSPALAPEAPRATEQPSYLRNPRPTPSPERASPPPPDYAPTMALPVMRPDQVSAPVVRAQPPPMFAPMPSEDENVNETAEVDVRCFRAALPFSEARAKASADSVAVPPAGKRLVRFDPQTGEPLSSPRWADVPIVESLGVPASFAASPPRGEPTGHETAAIPILQPRPVVPFSVGEAPARDAKNAWRPK